MFLGVDLKLIYALIMAGVLVGLLLWAFRGGPQ